MRIRKIDEVEIHLSHELFFDDPTQEWPRYRAHQLLFLFAMRRKLYMPVIRAFQKSSGLSGYIVLHAHGDTIDGEYWYQDGRRRHRMQNWINRNDGRASALIIISCNPENPDIYSHTSLVLHPHRKTSLEKLYHGGVRMFVPGIGYLNDNRKARRALAMFQKS